MQHYSLFLPDSEDGKHENAGDPSSRWLCSTDISSRTNTNRHLLYQQSQSKGSMSLEDCPINLNLLTWVLVITMTQTSFVITTMIMVLDHLIGRWSQYSYPFLFSYDLIPKSSESMGWVIIFRNIKTLHLPYDHRCQIFWCALSTTTD